MSRTFVTPKDLPEYLEFFAREAIRAQPKNIITFNRIFLDEIERSTEKMSFIEITGNPEKYQRFRENIRNRIENDAVLAKLTIEEKNEKLVETEAATKIQANVRGFLARKAAERRKESLQF